MAFVVVSTSGAAPPSNFDRFRYSPYRQRRLDVGGLGCLHDYVAEDLALESCLRDRQLVSAEVQIDERVRTVILRVGGTDVIRRQILQLQLGARDHAAAGIDDRDCDCTFRAMLCPKCIGYKESKKKCDHVGCNG